MPPLPEPDARPLRSALYIPASSPRALEKAQGLAADALIFDLEDAVAPEAKASARDALKSWLAGADCGARLKIVRINGLDSPWGAADAAGFAGGAADAVLIPKVGSPADLDLASGALPGVALWAMLESPAGILNATAIAAHPALDGLVMGTNDLAKDLGSRHRPDRLPLLPSLGLCLLAARAAGKPILDGVFNALDDAPGLAAECLQGRDLGFDGKTLIHPRQIEAANRAFASDAAEIDLAHRQIAAFEAAAGEGKGVAVVDGKIVENLHILTARRLLARAAAIAAMAESKGELP